MLDQDRDAAVVIRVTTASGFDSDRNIDDRKFTVLFRTDAGGQQSKVKSGEKLVWDDYFYYNLRDLESDDLILTLIMDDNEIGSAKLTYKRIKKQFGAGRETTKLPLQQNGRPNGYLHVQIQRMRGQQIIGGIEPPMVTLKPGVPLDDSFDFGPPLTQKGIERVRTAKLNFFSFCDANDLGRQFMPQKFHSKSLQSYLTAKSYQLTTGANQNQGASNVYND